MIKTHYIKWLAFWIKDFKEFCFNLLKQFVARINVQYRSQKAYPAKWLKIAWLVFGDGHNWCHQSCWWHLVALAVSLDGNGIKFGLGDNGNLSVEVDAKIENEFGDTSWWQKFSLVTKIKTYSPVITTSGDWTQIFAIFYFWNLEFWIIESRSLS